MLYIAIWQQWASKGYYDTVDTYTELLIYQLIKFFKHIKIETKQSPYEVGVG